MQVMAKAAAAPDAGGMGNPVPMKLVPIEPNPVIEVEIDAALIASGFDLDIAEFQRLMELRKITLLCERGTGEDAGLFRASYYYQGQRVRLVVDADGNPVAGRDDA